LPLASWCHEGSNGYKLFVAVKRETMKRIALFLLLAASGVAWAIPAQAQRMTLEESARKSRKDQKKQQKINRKVAKRQGKAMKKYLKAQRKADKKANRANRHNK